MPGSTIAHFFLALAVVLGCARLLGSLARRLGQPPVVGEICAGLLVSPMLLSPGQVGAILPTEVIPPLSAVADIGLAAFMFIAGYELDTLLWRRRWKASLGLIAGSIVCPLALGAALAVPLAERHASGDRTAFVLFVALAMSVTALPVLARIIRDRGLSGNPVGSLALGAAAIGDLFAWVSLAGVVAYAGAASTVQVALLPVYLIVMLTVVRPLLGKVVREARKRGSAPAALVPALFVGLLLSCAATELAGVHFIFGAFAFGAVMPRQALGDELSGPVTEAMGQLGRFLLPPYFVLAGMKVDLSDLGASAVLLLVLVLGAAMVSKTGGAYLGARLSGIDHAEALPTAVLMNTRGLTEIVIVAVALDAGIIDQGFYSVMVVMAIVTTAMTGPLLTLIETHRRFPAPVRPGSNVLEESR
ncbi:cation:proton antiporter [Streptomyces ossamyceticus]|uniref:Cation:proton antiporter n=1 Tax=Streptomyces ossamyceticus TaxID=249581 RepID=A0ABV2URY3_9ACTN